MVYFCTVASSKIYIFMSEIVLSSIAQGEVYSKNVKHIQFSVKSQLCFKGGWGIKELKFVVFFGIFNPIFQKFAVSLIYLHMFTAKNCTS